MASWHGAKMAASIAAKIAAINSICALAAWQIMAAMARNNQHENGISGETR